MAQSSDYDQAMLLGENAASNRQYAQAIQYFGHAIKLEPSVAEAYLNQMECAIQKRDLSVFKRTIQQLEGLEYSLPLDVYLTYAQLAKKHRLYNDGLAMLAKAELRFKKSKLLLLHRAELYQKLNNNAEVIKTLNEALTFDPKNLDIIHQLATIYIDVNPKKSVELFKKLLLEEAYKDSALSSLGLLHCSFYALDPAKNRSDLVQALDYYQAYFKRHPRDQDSRAIIEHLQTLLK
jgi:tetratricopeptide (TPR) repeat protein